MRISDWSSDVCSSDLEGAPTPGEVEKIVGRALGVARVADILFVEQILHREADAAEARLIAEEGVGQHIAFEIVARVAVRPVEAARQVELRLHPRRPRALRISGGEVQDRKSTRL